MRVKALQSDCIFALQDKVNDHISILQAADKDVIDVKFLNDKSELYSAVIVYEE